MKQFITELLTETHSHQHHFQHSPQQQHFDIPITYQPSQTNPPAKIKSFLQQDDTHEDIKSKLLRYNPSLSQYLDNNQSDTYVPMAMTYRTIDISQCSQNQREKSEANALKATDKNPQYSCSNLISSPIIEVIQEQPQQIHNISSISQQRVSNYISSLKDTRQMADTKFKKYFGKPCFANYGGHNTKMENGGIVYGEYMKTHNVSPHKGDNHPKTQETYQSALLHANRVILNKNKDAEEVEREAMRKERERQEEEDRQRGISRSKARIEVANSKSARSINVSKNSLEPSIVSKQELKQEYRNITENQHKNFQNKAKHNYPDHYLVPLKKQPKAKLPTSKHNQPKKVEINSKGVKPISKVQKQSQKQHSEMQQNKPFSYTITELYNAGTQTLTPQQEINYFVSPPLNNSNTKLESSISNIDIKSNPPQKNPNPNPRQRNVVSQTVIIEQPSPILVTRPAPLFDHQPKPLRSHQNSYSYQEQQMPPAYTYCLCKHKACQHKVKLKHQAFQKGLEDPEIAQRIISVAKKAGMYDNYTPKINGCSEEQIINPQKRNKEKAVRSYYEIPREKMNPQNYGCQQVEELEQIPYAGKARRYHFNNL